jgi:hypothetical protein
LVCEEAHTPTPTATITAAMANTLILRVRVLPCSTATCGLLGAVCQTGGLADVMEITQWTIYVQEKPRRAAGHSQKLSPMKQWLCACLTRPFYDGLDAVMGPAPSERLRWLSPDR